MNAPIDKNINAFHKGFLTTKQGGFEDPTYLGFKLVFEFNPSYRNLETGQTDDPLFSEKDDLESAIRYLKSTGYPNRAKMLQEFKSNLQYVNENTPWYWQTLSGLQDIWKIEFGENFNPFRGKDKVIEITCLESIDLRITALADLYRKATFDTKYMRALLPENLRWFSLRVQVAEMRSFQKIKEAIEKIESPTQNVPNNPNTQAIGDAVQKSSFNVVSSTPSQSASQKEPQVENMDDLISLMEFHFTHCTFDFWDSFPSDKELTMNGEMDMAKQKFKINVGHIQENHQYKIMDLVLKDGVNQETGSFKQSIPTFGNAFTKKSDNIFSNALQGVSSQLQDRLNQVASIPGNLIARGENTLGSAINGAVLGNVYGAQNQSLQTILNGFLGHNAQVGGTTISPGENALTPAPTPQTYTKEDVYPNVPGQDLSTKNYGNQGNIYK